jgi:hypothetical protein
VVSEVILSGKKGNVTHLMAKAQPKVKPRPKPVKRKAQEIEADDEVVDAASIERVSDGLEEVPTRPKRTIAGKGRVTVVDDGIDVLASSSDPVWELDQSMEIDESDSEEEWQGLTVDRMDSNTEEVLPKIVRAPEKGTKAPALKEDKDGARGKKGKMVVRNTIMDMREVTHAEVRCLTTLSCEL